MHSYNICFPLIHNNQNSKKIMLLVILALMPGIIIQIYYFNYGIIMQILLSLIIGLLLEIIFFKLRGISIYDITDCSAILTSLLFSIIIPPLSSWWIIFLGNLFSLTLTKHVYGGLGKNIFNPAMTGYVIILISFPMQIYYSTIKSEDLNYFKTLNLTTYIDVVFKKKNVENNIVNQNINFNIFSKKKIQDINTLKKKYPLYKINVCFLIGGIFLLFSKVIKWYIPLSFLSSLVFFSSITSIFYTNTKLYLIDQFFISFTILSAFFIATDPVTSPITKTGKLIFGIIIGFFVSLMRVFGNYSDGLAFAILIANSIVPLIDYFSKKLIENKF